MGYRVIQWATGQVGRAAIRAIAEHPQLELAGALVYSDTKNGRDAGELAGIGPLGVLATTSRAEILSLDADCVIYTPKAEPEIADTVADICAILETGKNVSATALMTLFGRTVPEPWRSRIEEACRKGKSSFLSTGIQPGFFMDALPAIVASNNAGLRHILCREIYHYANHTAANTVVNFLDIGKPLAVKEATIAVRRTMAEPVMRLLGEMLGSPIDEVELEYELVAADEAFEIAAATIERGMLAAYRRTYSGKSRGRAILTFDYVHRAAPHVAPHWPYPGDPAGLQWSAVLDGRPPVRFAVDVDPIDAREIHPGSQMVGHRAVNSVPVVCDGPPGILTPFDIPQPVGFLVGDE